MKKILKIPLLIVCSLIAFNLSSQNIQNFLGKYKIQVDCIVDCIPDYFEYHTYEIEIEENHEENSNIKFLLDQHDIWEYIKAMVVNDHDFDIPSQQFIKEYGEYYFVGYGNIKDDSIFMQYIISSENVSGILTCNCKGKKVDSVNIVSPSKSDNKVYYDAKTQVLVIDKTLQKQSITLELYDMQGKVILRKTDADSVSIDNLPAGVYLYRLLENGRAICSGKILKED